MNVVKARGPETTIGEKRNQILKLKVKFSIVLLGKACHKNMSISAIIEHCILRSIPLNKQIIPRNSMIGHSYL